MPAPQRAVGVLGRGRRRVEVVVQPGEPEEVALLGARRVVGEHVEEVVEVAERLRAGPWSSLRAARAPGCRWRTGSRTWRVNGRIWSRIGATVSREERLHLAQRRAPAPARPGSASRERRADDSSASSSPRSQRRRGSRRSVDGSSCSVSRIDGLLVGEGAEHRVRGVDELRPSWVSLAAELLAEQRGSCGSTRAMFSRRSASAPLISREVARERLEPAQRRPRAPRRARRGPRRRPASSSCR